MGQMRIKYFPSLSPSHPLPSLLPSFGDAEGKSADDNDRGGERIKGPGEPGQVLIGRRSNSSLS